MHDPRLYVEAKSGEIKELKIFMESSQIQTRAIAGKAGVYCDELDCLFDIFFNCEMVADSSQIGDHRTS